MTWISKLSGIIVDYLAEVDLMNIRVEYVRSRSEYKQEEGLLRKSSIIAKLRHCLDINAPEVLFTL